MTKWNKVRIGDVVKTNISSYSKKDQWDFVNYLDTGNITMNIVNQIQRIDLNSDKLPSRAKRKVFINDVIYSTVRPNQRHYGIIKKIPDNFLVSTGFAVLHPDMSKVNADYLYYWLSQEDIIDSLQTIAEQRVSTYPSLKPSDIENLEVSLPDLETQDKIVSILNCISDKIVHNNKINKNLVA